MILALSPADERKNLATLVEVYGASPAVRTAAVAAARAAGHQDRLNLARGGYRGMNGNYAGGVLEGIVHFMPEVDDWLDEVPLT
jgi:hypothetical protein